MLSRTGRSVTLRAPERTLKLSDEEGLQLWLMPSGRSSGI